MTLPPPSPGLVISYAYLWADEHAAGAVESRKDRPCAIVAARTVVGGRTVVTVLPVTHRAPAVASDAVELPPAVKAHLGLDEARSWVIVSEVNSFFWPGPDLRPVSRTKPGVFQYGFLPPRFFAHLRDRVVENHRRGAAMVVPRS